MEKIVQLLIRLKEWSVSYESDEDFMSRMMKEYNENNLKKIS